MQRPPDRLQRVLACPGLDHIRWNGDRKTERRRPAGISTGKPRVDCELTELGRDVVVLLDGVIRWSEDHVSDITAARERYDAGMEAREAAFH